MSVPSSRPPIPRPSNAPRPSVKPEATKSDAPPPPVSSVRSVSAVVPRPKVLEIELADDDIVEAVAPSPSKPPPPPPVRKSSIPTTKPPASLQPKVPAIAALRVPNFDAVEAPTPAWEAPASAIRPTPIVGVGAPAPAESEPARSTLTPPEPVLSSIPPKSTLETKRPGKLETKIEPKQPYAPPPVAEKKVASPVKQAPVQELQPRSPLPMPVLANLTRPAVRPEAIVSSIPSASAPPPPVPPSAPQLVASAPPPVAPMVAPVAAAPIATPAPAPVAFPPPAAVAPPAPAPMATAPVTMLAPMRAPQPSITKTFGSLTDPTDILFDVLCELEFADTAKGAAQMCADGLARALGARAVIIHMHDDGHSELRTLAAHGPRTAALVGSTEPSEDDFIGGAVLCNGKPVSMSFDGELPMLAPRRLKVIGVNRSVVAVPAMIWKRCVAIIEVVDADERYAPRTSDAASYVAKRLAEYLVQRAAA